jgi:hypothetical protein
MPVFQLDDVRVGGLPQPQRFTSLKNVLSSPLDFCSW